MFGFAKISKKKINLQASHLLQLMISIYTKILTFAQWSNTKISRTNAIKRSKNTAGQE